MLIACGRCAAAYSSGVRTSSTTAPAAMSLRAAPGSLLGAGAVAVAVAPGGGESEREHPAAASTSATAIHAFTTDLRPPRPRAPRAASPAQPRPAGGTAFSIPSMHAGNASCMPVSGLAAPRAAGAPKRSTTPCSASTAIRPPWRPSAVSSPAAGRPRHSGQRTVLIHRGSTILAAVKHRETYLALLSPTHRDRLLVTLEEEGILTLLKAHALEVVDATPIPYVRLEITAGENGLVAHCTGVWFDARPLLCPEVEQDYYLPVLGVPQGASASTIRHELLHLHDLLALIEQDPSYPERALKLSINSISEPSQIEDSVDFELFKIFAMEPQAYRLEYSLGETWIDTSHDGHP